MSATFANLRTAGCFPFRALHKSYCDCMFIHNSGVVPKAPARRIAMDAEIPALPLSTREWVTLVIREEPNPDAADYALPSLLFRS
jgi:hypothetical protein